MDPALPILVNIAELRESSLSNLTAVKLIPKRHLCKSCQQWSVDYILRHRSRRSAGDFKKTSNHQKVRRKDDHDHVGRTIQILNAILQALQAIIITVGLSTCWLVFELVIWLVGISQNHDFKLYHCFFPVSNGQIWSNSAPFTKFSENLCQRTVLRLCLKAITQCLAYKH